MQRDFHVMGDNHQRPALARQFPKAIGNHPDAARIELRCRLVQHEKRPAVGHGQAGERQSPLLALAEFERMSYCELTQSPTVQNWEPSAPSRTVTSCIGLHRSRPQTQTPIRVLFVSARRFTDVAPTTSKLRR